MTHCTLSETRGIGFASPLRRMLPGMGFVFLSLGCFFLPLSRVWPQHDSVAIRTGGARTGHKPPLTIMLDPGHGGSNTGASAAYDLGPPSARSTTRVYEKSITLAIARATVRALERTASAPFRVLLTRSSDRYLTLESRVVQARRANAALFISIHLNASDTHTQQGVETYLLSARASSREARRVAALENDSARPRSKASELAVPAILASLQLQRAAESSRILARSIQAALANRRPGVRDRGVRSAPFDVLMGHRIPAVLVEVGFIDHPEEGARLVRIGEIKAVGRALAQGIVAYYNDKSVVHP